MVVHVYPIGDTFEHETEGTDCWCEPEVRWIDEETGEFYVEPLVIHNAADGRELTE